MTIKTPKFEKMIRSAGIVLTAIGVFFAIKWLLPSYDMRDYEAALVVGAGAWLTNAIREATKIIEEDEAKVEKKKPGRPKKIKE